MSCHIHNQKQHIANCKVCNKPICKECQNIQNHYDACPSCSKEQLKNLYGNYKRGLIANVLSVLCVIAFFVFYAIDVAADQVEQALVIVGPIVGGILAVVSIALLIRTIVKMFSLKKLLNDIK